MAKPTPQQCHAMTSHYVKVFREKYGHDPVVNRHSARWGFDSVLQGLPPAEVKDLLDFYLTTGSTRKHPLEWFFYNYDKLIEQKSDVDADRKHRAKMREESKKRSEEWRKRGNIGTQGN